MTSVDFSNPIFKQPLHSEAQVLVMMQEFAKCHLLTEDRLKTIFDAVTKLVKEDKQLDPKIFKNVALLIRDKERMYKNNDFARVHQLLDEIVESLQGLLPG